MHYIYNLREAQLKIKCLKGIKRRIKKTIDFIIARCVEFLELVEKQKFKNTNYNDIKEGTLKTSIWNI